MKHLKGGVKKGAFDEAAMQQKFEAWKQGKDQKTTTTRENVAKGKKEAAAKELEQEKKINEAIAKKVADKKAAEALPRLRPRPLLRLKLPKRLPLRLNSSPEKKLI